MYRATLLSLLILISCYSPSEERANEKFNDLANYYSNVLNLSLPKNGIIIILQNQRCSSCRLSTFLRLSQLLKSNILPKTFLLSKNDSTLINIISTIPNKVVLFDTENIRKDYGLDYATDLVFLLKESKLKNWFELSNANLDNLKSIE